MNSPPSLLLLLGGGRGNWPNLWSVLALRPAEVLILPPQGDKEQSSRHLLPWLNERCIPAAVLPEVDPYAVEPCFAAIEDILRDRPRRPAWINATQCPTLMKIAAERAAAAFRHEGVIPFLALPGRGTIVPFRGDPPQLHPVTASLDDYLAMYGFLPPPATSQPEFPLPAGEQDALLDALITPAYRELVLKLRKSRNRRPDEPPADRALLVLDDLPQEEAELTERLVRAGLLRREPAPGGSLLLRADDRAWRFLDGGWLEAAALRAALATRSTAGKPLFLDCRSGVRCRVRPVPGRPADEFDVDLAALTPDGSLLVASCKSVENAFRSRPARRRLTDGDDRRPKEHLQELADWANRLGGAYCARMLITNTPGQNLTDYTRVQALERRIDIVCLEDLPKLSNGILESMEGARARAR